jgi:hypothetical protein
MKITTSRMLSAAAMALLAALTGCGGTPGTTADPAAHDFSSGDFAAAGATGIAGKFTGPVDDSVRHHGDLVFELSQTGNNPGGTRR